MKMLYSLITLLLLTGCSIADDYPHWVEIQQYTELDSLGSIAIEKDSIKTSAVMNTVPRGGILSQILISRQFGENYACTMWVYYRPVDERYEDRLLFELSKSLEIGGLLVKDRQGCLATKFIDILDSRKKVDR